MAGKKRGRVSRVAKRVETAMDFPCGTLTGTAIMELEGNRRAVVAGCRGIRMYTEDCICLQVPGGTVSFFGCELELGCLTEDGATVVGRLQRIEFAE